MIGWMRRRELRNAYVTSFIVKTIILASNADKLNFHRCHGELVGRGWDRACRIAPNGFHLEISTAYVNIIKNDERPELAGIINTISRLLSGQMKSLAAVKWFQNGETNGLLHERTTFVERGWSSAEREREREGREEKFQFHRLMNEGVLIISNDLENDRETEQECSTHSVNPPPVGGVGSRGGIRALMSLAAC